MLSAALLWLFGCAWLIFVQVSEVPFGYQTVTFEKLQPAPGELIPDLARDMEDKKVFIKGYMRSGRRLAGIRTSLFSEQQRLPLLLAQSETDRKDRIALKAIWTPRSPATCDRGGRPLPRRSEQPHPLQSRG